VSAGRIDDGSAEGEHRSFDAKGDKIYIEPRSINKE
jgi:hypothetical protein